MIMLKYCAILLEVQLLGILHNTILERFGYDMTASIVEYSDDWKLWLSFIILGIICGTVAYKFSQMVD